MQSKPEDRPKIIGLIIAIVVLLIVALARLIPAFTGKDTSAAANNPAAGTPASATSVTPASATGAAGMTAAAGNPGQMRRFDDTLDTDAPAGSGGGNFGGHTDAFRVIAAPKQAAVTKPQNTRIMPSFGGRPPLSIYTAPPIQPTVQMVAAPPLEVVLDGVYQAGQEKVAQLTILSKDTVKDASGKSSSAASEQTVYRRVGEYIGRFKIARLTENGLALAGQQRSWTVGETEKLDEGLMRAPVVTAPAQALPILLPR